ncbi:hypothetical protein pEaSNUABM50_00502 [Erwinia phage pEa_SNUABM_50]|uniref:Lipoprotein n=4 Tax=Eneladusvirus BF TaxID=2560751 RepID=A0A7L8ZNU3_9CAUD|nr:hypothetical protein FDH34_gp440 [Serratia phage BF]QOI71466.1 hypothetical protein pEaSNUABM12_00554 [Erwinia phage pEa_SNUABM_12]QOI71957.1 hypothetical protein pEaSNUABM47_00503 [Erwinia phage pEa_SNUABM_47]QOI72497.1 hypothetical protein pEaSNUABM50_00502 [Erwinia phage pEa_SNUABM_50]QXO11625.1 hypothetical protein pEaSNUABM19_00509 [Erwinia phage pEa_SNUABM_19]QXO12173.1 hypothetical protein pEaSNUABM44_00507 [Erwinia phage pEa_SNUABM_44]QXO12729.1 hypothetical protein pEaSNUABM49_005
MKYILVLISALLITGCEPVSADNTSTNAPKQNNSKYDSNESNFDPVRLSENTVVLYGTSNNQVLLKRVEDVDGTCWVTLNTKNWDSSVSCVRKEHTQTETTAH